MFAHFLTIFSPLSYFMPYIFVGITYKPDIQGLLSMPVNNTTLAHHFPLLTVITTLHSRI